jgi:AcrR family transcriptional regulator
VARTRTRRGKYDRSQSAAERKADQRTKLLDVATQVFASKGYQDATVEAIIDRAGMSRRTFYEHFRDLRDVLAQVYDRAAMISLTMVASSARAHGDPFDALRAGVAAYLTAVASYPEVARVLFVEYRQGGGDFERRYQRDSARYAELLRELLLAAYKAKRLDREPSETSVFTLAKGIEALAMRAIVQGEHRRLPKLAPEIAELVIAAFR